MKTAIVDTGPLVACLDERDQYHAWAVDVFRGVSSPLLTCEGVLTEACFLVRHIAEGPEAVVKTVLDGAIRLAFHAEEEMPAVSRLMQTCRDLPISYTDACLVRMTELYSRCSVVTLDRHFRIYRRNRRQVIPVVMPSE